MAEMRQSYEGAHGMQMDRARCERKAAWDHAEHEGPRMESWHAALQAKSAIRPAAITVNQKSRLVALCHKPALLRIKLDEAH